MLKYVLSIFLISSLLLMESFSVYASGIENLNELSSIRKRKREEAKENDLPPFKKYKIDETLIANNNENNTAGSAPSIVYKELTIVPVYEQQFWFCSIELPSEIMFHIFTFLPVPEIVRMSQVNKSLNKLSEVPQLWKEVRHSIYGDYPENEATKENAKLHWLRVIVNTLTDVEKIDHLVRKYKLNINYDLPYLDIEHEYIKHLANLRQIIEEKAAQRNEEFIQLKLESLRWGHYGYEKDRMKAFAFLEQLINQGNGIAIWKMKALWQGGLQQFMNDLNGASSFNEALIENGKLVAHEHKIEGLMYGLYGHEKNPEAAMGLNEMLVKEGNEAAIQTKIKALLNGMHGYEYSPQDAVGFNDDLIAQRNKRAIERKLEGLERGINGYQRDYNAFTAYKNHIQLTHPEALGKYIDEFLDEGNYQGFMRVNESLVEKGDEQAILRKIKLLSGYHHDSLYNYECYDDLCETCEPWEHTGGTDYRVLELLIDRFVEKGSKVAIQSKVLSFISGLCEYGQRDSTKLKSWLEEEESCGKRWAYFFKAQGLKYGILGFKKDLEVATDYIKQYGIPFYLKNFS